MISNVTIKDYACNGSDKISLLNCQDMRVTGCDITSGDDSLYISSSYRDPRGLTWFSSAEPQPSKNIEIDNNRCFSAPPCKAFCMILWGGACPDQRLVEVSNVYVHDNYFNTMGMWYVSPYDSQNSGAPVKNVRFEDNLIGEIQDNFH